MNFSTESSVGEKPLFVHDKMADTQLMPLPFEGSPTMCGFMQNSSVHCVTSACKSAWEIASRQQCTKIATGCDFTLLWQSWQGSTKPSFYSRGRPTVNILKPLNTCFADSFPARRGHLQYLPDAQRLGLHPVVQHAHQPPKGKTAPSGGTE